MERLPSYLNVGRKYRVIYSIDGGRTYYQSTGKLVAVEADTLYLNLQPVKPLVKIRRQNLTKIEAVKSDTAATLNHRWFGTVSDSERSKQ